MDGGRGEWRCGNVELADVSFSSGRRDGGVKHRIMLCIDVVYMAKCKFNREIERRGAP